MPSTHDEEMDWKPCPAYKYKTIKLPMGDEFSHTEFQPVKYQSKKGKGAPQTEDAKKQEALRQYQSKEAKAMKSVEETHSDI